MEDVKYKSVLSGCLDNLPTLNSRLVRIFLSSTFTDTQEERNILLEDVYPQLKTYCKEKYGMDFQLVDMRWGVPIEAADDHLATALCLEEIHNCQKLSTGPNFVTFLNQKHGYRPLQVSIPDVEFQHLVSCLQEHGRDLSLLEAWYLKDNNQVPPVYVLQPISSLLPNYKDKDNISARGEWDMIFKCLREDLKFASNLCHKRGLMTEERKHKYFMSVTEDEIFNGILKLPESAVDHCLVFVRIIEDITSHLDHTKAARFIDVRIEDDTKLIDEEAQGILGQLRDDKIVKKLPNVNIMREWPINRLDHGGYLETFKATFYTSIVALIDKAVTKERSLIQDDLYIEVLQHASMAVQRCEMFHGREDILREIGDYLRHDQVTPLVLYGQSGCGKTSLMAQTCRMVPSVTQTAVVVLRFLGTSPGSSNLWRLLSSLCHQIVVCYGRDTTEIPEDFDALKDYFLQTLKFATREKPLVILLDSLDQLSREHNSYKLNWLPRKLPPEVKLLLSTYTEATDLIATLRLTFLSSNFLFVPVFTPELSSTILGAWLSKRNRTLSSEQFELVEQAFEKCSLPLFVKLIFDEVVTWRSYMPLSQCKLPHTVQQVIEELFIKLEKKHGTVLVSRALGYLTASKTGISETELEDLLSLDDTVLTSVFQIHVPPFRRIPPLLWVRIRHDIGQYLVDKEVDEVRSFFWYHRQFYETAKKRYLSNESLKLELHSLMADYYIGLWYQKKKPFKYTDQQMKRVGVSSPDGEADRRISGQPLIFSKGENDKDVRYNKRKLSKLPYHLYTSNRQTELRNMCLFNYEWIQTGLRALSLQEVLLDYKKFGEKENIIHKILKAAQSTLKRFPNTLAMELSGRLLPLLQKKSAPDTVKLLMDSLQASEKQCRLVPYQPCYNIPSESLLYELEHPKIPVNCKMSAFSNDSAHLAILTNDNEVLIWDVVSGEMETGVNFAVEEDQKFNVMIKPKGKDLLIVGATNQMKSNPVCIVDINTAVLEKDLKLDKQYTAIGFNSDLTFDITGKHLIVSFVRQAADVFDLESGKLLHEFDGKPDQTELIADDKMIILHPKQTNMYTIYNMDTFDFVNQVTCTESPQCLFLNFKSDLGCIVMTMSPVLQLLHLSADDKVGQVAGNVDLSKSLSTKIQEVAMYDNLLLVTTMSGIILWDLKAKKMKNMFEIPAEVQPSYRVMEFQGVITPDGKTLIAAYEKYFVVWDLKSGKLLLTKEATRGRISKMMLTPSGEYVMNIAKRNNSITAWKLSSLLTKTADYRPLCMTDSARYLTVDQYGTTAVVRSMTSNEFAIIDIHQGAIRCHISQEYEAMNPAVTQDGKYAVLREYNSDNSLKIWDTLTGKLVKSFPVSSLTLKGYVLGTKPENMGMLIEDERTGNHSLTFYEVPSGRESLSINLQKYNMMQIFFAKGDEYCLIGIEEQLHPGIKIYTKSFGVKTGFLEKEYPKLHPKFIQMITPESDCFLGQRITADTNGKELWELVVLNIETGETIVSCKDAPSSALCLGARGRYGIDKERWIFDIKKGKKCFQFDSEGDYHEMLPSSRTAPKLTADEKYAVWLQLSTNLLKVGDLNTQTLISNCPIHSMPMNISVTPLNIILIGCEDGRIMMLQMMMDTGKDSESTFKNIFMRSQHQELNIRDSVMGRQDIGQKKKRKKSAKGERGDKGTGSKACVVL